MKALSSERAGSSCGRRPELSFMGHRLLDGMGVKLRALFPTQKARQRLSEVHVRPSPHPQPPNPPLPPPPALPSSRPKWQASLCGRWAEPGQAWKGTGVTWSPWKWIPERESFELRSQRIRPVFDDDSYHLRRTAQCSDLCGAEALECQGNPAQVEELQALRE